MKRNHSENEDNKKEDQNEDEGEEQEEFEKDQNVIKTRPREYYEQAYVDFLRHQKPIYTEFVDFVHKKFRKANYNVR